MAESFRYQFAWDPAKAHDNLAKHDIGFEQAATVFRDPLAVTVYDSEHSAAEERWATLGRSESGALLVVTTPSPRPAPIAPLCGLFLHAGQRNRKYATTKHPCGNG